MNTYKDIIEQLEHISLNLYKNRGIDIDYLKEYDPDALLLHNLASKLLIIAEENEAIIFFKDGIHLLLEHNYKLEDDLECHMEFIYQASKDLITIGYTMFQPDDRGITPCDLFKKIDLDLMKDLVKHEATV